MFFTAATSQGRYAPGVLALHGCRPIQMWRGRCGVCADPPPDGGAAANKEVVDGQGVVSADDSGRQNGCQATEGGQGEETPTAVKRRLRIAEPHSETSSPGQWSVDGCLIEAVSPQEPPKPRGGALPGETLLDGTPGIVVKAQEDDGEWREEDRH